MDGQQATGDPIAYHRPISFPPDDVSSQLERLLDEQPADGHDPIAADGPSPAPLSIAEPSAEPEPEPELAPEPEPEAPPAAVPAAAPIAPVPPVATRQALDDQFDELRSQLDDAFNEMAERINRAEVRVVALRSAFDEQAEVRMQADEELASGLVADRLHLESALDQLRRDVIAWRDAPVTVDTRQLEEEVRQGTLHNAADIANMARDVDNLGKVLRLQAERLNEVQTTLEWIKQRILNR